MPDSSDPVTLGEVYRRLSEFERRFDAAVRTINQQITENSRDYIHVDRYIAERAAQGERIGAVEADVAEILANNKWRDRTMVLTALTVAVNVAVGIALLLIGGGLGR
jgi:hypothetical protein